MGIATFSQPSFFSVATHTARNTIPNTLRTPGMLVYTQADTAYWAWNGGTAGTDGDWTQAGPFQVQLAGSVVANRGAMNFIQGSNVTLTVADNSGADRCDVTIAASAAGTPGGSSGQVQINSSGSFAGVAVSAIAPILMSQALGTYGDAVLTAGSTTYGTDRTTALQSLINSAASAGQLVIGDGRYSHTGLTLPGNSRIEWLPNCGTILRAGSNAQLYQNATLSLGVGGTRGTTAGGDTAGTIGAITDMHIRMRGGIHNCNTQNQTAVTASSLLHGTRFWGVSDIYFEDCTFIDGSLWFANCEYFGGKGITSINSLTGSGSAGPQLNGPCRYFDFDDVTCVSPADDGFAMNADDGDNALAGGLPYPFGGPITDGTLRGLRIAGGQQGLRFLSTSQRIDRIVVDGVTGDTKYAWALFSRFADPSTGAERTGTFGPGNIGSISISNIDINITAVNTPAYSEIGVADVFIDTQFDSLTFRGWKKDLPAAEQAAMYVAPVAGNTAYGSLKVTDFHYLEGVSAHTGPAFLLSGNVRSVQISAAGVVRNQVAGGGVSPLIRVDAAAPTVQPGDITVGPGTILVTGLYSDNCDSAVEIVSGSVTSLLKLEGRHSAAGGNAAVTVAAGALVRNLSLGSATTGLISVPVSSKKWSGSGTVSHDLDAAGTYTEPSVLFNDLLAGTSGTVLSSHTPDSGGSWPTDAGHQAGAGLLELDGSGGIFLAGGDSANIPSAAMPSGDYEVVVKYKRYTALTVEHIYVTLNTTLYGGSGTQMFLCFFEPSNTNPGIYFSADNVTPAGSIAPLPAVGVTTYIRIRKVTSGADTTYRADSSPDGIVWTNLGVTITVATPTAPVAIGPYMALGVGSAWTASTGPHFAGPLTIRALG